MQRICVFCGSNAGFKPEYLESAKSVGKFLAERQIELVYGGGKVGLMGAIADSVLENGGKVVGIIPECLVAKEVSHQSLTKLHIVGSMHERKALMAELSDGVIALPGGFGTFDELCEILTWAQLGFHHKPCGLLNVAGFYDPLIAAFDHATNEGFVREAHRNIVLVANNIENLYDKMMKYLPPTIEKWHTK